MLLPLTAGLAITGYKYALSVSTNSGSSYGPYGDYVLSSWTSGTTFTITGLTNGYYYKVKVRAVNALGDGAESAEIGAFVPNTVPGAPTAVQGTSHVSGQSSVSWVAPTDNGGIAISYYTVQYSTNGSSWTTFGTTSVSSPLIVNELSNGTPYYFRVAATNNGTNGGTGAYSNASATTATPSTVPSAPATPTITALDGGDRFNWTTPADGGRAITGYVYQISTNDQAFATEVSVAANVTSVTLTNQYSASTFKIKVKAINGNSTGSPYSTTSVNTVAWAQNGQLQNNPTPCDPPTCAACDNAPTNCAACDNAPTDCGGCTNAPTDCGGCTAPDCSGGCDGCGGTRTATAATRTAATNGTRAAATSGTRAAPTLGTSTRTCYRWTRESVGSTPSGYSYAENSTSACGNYSTCTSGTCGACGDGACGACASGACGACGAGACGSCGAGSCSACSDSYFKLVPIYGIQYSIVSNYLGDGVDWYALYSSEGFFPSNNVHGGCGSAYRLWNLYRCNVNYTNNSRNGQYEVNTGSCVAS